MEVLREQETGHSSEAGIRRLFLPALPVSCINKSERNQHFRTIRSKVIFLAPLNMILIHRKQLSGCHTASSPISPPLILPIHILSPHVTPNLRPLLKQKNSSQARGSVCPSCLIKMLLTKKHRLLLLSLSLNHFSSISSALVSSLLPTSPEESTTTTPPSSSPSSSPRSGGGVENKRHKRPTH